MPGCECNFFKYLYSKKMLHKELQEGLLNNPVQLPK